MKSKRSPRFVMCTTPKGIPASVEVRKIYRVVEDRTARTLGLLRIVDESGADYLHPSDQFVSVHLPASAQKTVLLDQ